MNITTKDLRKEPGKVLKKVANGQQVFVTYRGKKVAQLIHISPASTTGKSVLIDGKDDIFGLWKDHDNRLSVDETVRKLRQGRKF